MKGLDAEAPLSGLRGLTDADIASFKALGAEVCFASEAYGEVWLVPAYTGQARKELTPEHAATLVRVLSAFPGSRVLSFTKQPASAEASP
ncbi:ABM domain-containing protein [Myxococcus xanthus]